MVYYRYCNSLYCKVKAIRVTAFREIRKEWMNVPEGVLEFNLEFANQVEWAQLRRKRKNWGHIVFSVEVQKDCCEAFSIEAVALLFFEVSLLRQDVRNEDSNVGLWLKYAERTEGIDSHIKGEDNAATPLSRRDEVETGSSTLVSAVSKGVTFGSSLINAAIEVLKWACAWRKGEVHEPGLEESTDGMGVQRIPMCREVRQYDTPSAWGTRQGMVPFC